MALALVVYLLGVLSFLNFIMEVNYSTGRGLTVTRNRRSWPLRGRGRPPRRPSTR